MNPFLARLDHELRSLSNTEARAQLVARSAGYLARIGDFESAKASINQIRNEFGDGRSGRVTIAVMIAEALVFHYQSLDSRAFDRIIRAQFLGRFTNDEALEAVASAWRAHFEFDHSKFREMYLSLGIAIHRTSTENNEANARIANVLCKVATLCGEEALAKAYFKSGREFALKEKDLASVEAMQHNRAAFRLAYARSRMCFQSLSKSEIDEIRTDVETAKSLQNLSGVKALSSYIALCDARMLILEEQFERAIQALKALQESGPYPEGSFTVGLINLEIMYCLGRMNKIDDVLSLLEPSSDIDLSKVDFDERLVATWIQRQLSEIDSRLGNPELSASRFESACKDYEESLSDLKLGLRSVAAIFPS